MICDNLYRIHFAKIIHMKEMPKRISNLNDSMRQACQIFIIDNIVHIYQFKQSLSIEMGDCMSKQNKKKENPVHRTIVSPPQPKPDYVVLKLEYPFTPSQSLLKKLNVKMSPTELIKVKIPQDQTKTTFVWQNQPVLIFPVQIAQQSVQKVKKSSFQEKLAWFRHNLQKKRIPWTEGSVKLKIDRWNIVHSSAEQLKDLKDLKMFKEIKIDFNDENTNDAGGLLREWMHLCIKEILSPDVGIFTMCMTDQTAYQIKRDKDLVHEIVQNYLYLMGLFIGKSIFQRISLNCFLDRTIIRQLCGQPIHINDVYSFDKELYSSCAYILKEQNVGQMGLTFSQYVTFDGKSFEYELVPNGKNIPVTEENKQKYIQKLILFSCRDSIKKYIQILKDSLNHVIPAELLNVFEPHQFQMLLNGPINIDIEDWKDNTQYEGYSSNEDIVKWFWEEVGLYEQEQLRNLLHYCTGSSRVPILGFKYLESNRGEIKKFTIRKVQFDSGNPYPKSHTCFNRLELPNYANQEEMGNYIRIIMFEEFNHFGLD